MGAATAGFGLVPVQEPDRVPGDVPRAVGHGAHARRVPLPPVRRRREANLPVHQLHWHHQGLVLLLIHLSLISLYGDYYLVVSNECRRRSELTTKMETHRPRKTINMIRLGA